MQKSPFDSEYLSVYPKFQCDQTLLWQLLTAATHGGRVAKKIRVPDVTVVHEGRLLLLQTDIVSQSLQSRELQNWMEFSALLRDSVGVFLSDVGGGDPRYAAVAKVFFHDGPQAGAVICHYDINQLGRDRSCAVIAQFPIELMRFKGLVRAILRDNSLSGGSMTVQVDFLPFDWKAGLPPQSKKHLNGRIEFIDGELTERVRESIESLRGLLESFCCVQIDFMDVRFIVDMNGDVWISSLEQLGFYPAVATAISTPKTSCLSHTPVKCQGRFCSVVHSSDCMEMSELFMEFRCDEIEQAIVDGTSFFISDALKRYGFQRAPDAPSEYGVTADLCERCIRARLAVFTALKNYEIGTWGSPCQSFKADMKTDDTFYRKCKLAMKAYDAVSPPDA